MPISTLSAFLARIETPREIATFSCAATSYTAGRAHDMWLAKVPAGVAPSSPVVPARDADGAIGQRNPESGQLSLLGAQLDGVAPGTYLVCDRLSHQGGLSGTVTGAQTTNLPTAALTRYTSGDGVMLGLSIYTAVGTTATTVTASYTNQDGTSGRTTPAVVFGGTGFNAAGRLILLPLQEGDSGVRSVASVTLAASTGTAGNFGVVLFRPLLAICVSDASAVAPIASLINGASCGGAPTIIDDACLFLAHIGSSANGVVQGRFCFAEN